MLRVALPAVLGALALATSPAASAAVQRYASPGGSDIAACSSANPCSLTKAVTGAVSGDEVIVTPGDYPLTATLSATGITIHGVAGRPRPRLLTQGIWAAMTLNYSTLRYLEVDHAPGQAGELLDVHNSSLDQVVAKGSAQPQSTTVWSRNAVIRNSIIVAPGPDGTAILTYQHGGFVGGTFRNVTAMATEAGGVAIRATSDAGSASVLARNVIARGGAGGASLRADAVNGASAKITVDHSNWVGGDAWGGALVDGGGNQTAAPAFANAAAGDYREAAGSPTINAGLSEIIDGDVDVEGDPREIYGIDIGADEFVLAPAATTGPAGTVTDHSATLRGTVDAKGAPTRYRFEYGPTAAYGSTTPSTAAGAGTVAAAAKLAGLSPARTYHYRVVATNAGGTAKGADRTLTTATPPPSVHEFAGVKLVATRLTVRRRSIALKLSCPATAVGRCSGRAKLTTRRVRLGRVGFSIAAGRQATVKVRLSRAGRRLLARGRRLRAKERNAARDGAGRTKTTVAAVTIRRRRT